MKKNDLFLENISFAVTNYNPKFDYFYSIIELFEKKVKKLLLLIKIFYKYDCNIYILFKKFDNSIMPLLILEYILSSFSISSKLTSINENLKFNPGVLNLFPATLIIPYFSIK